VDFLKKLKSSSNYKFHKRTARDKLMNFSSWSQAIIANNEISVTSFCPNSENNNSTLQMILYKNAPCFLSRLLINKNRARGKSFPYISFVLNLL